jgi:RNA polymerase sigma-70 factor, ECF subfamily
MIFTEPQKKITIDLIQSASSIVLEVGGSLFYNQTYPVNQRLTASLPTILKGLRQQVTLLDSELLHNLQQQQPGSLGCLYDRYGSLVYGVALKVLQNQTEAEDVTQEIFLAIWQRPIDPAKQDHLMRYLIAIARTRSIDKLRSRRRTLNLVQRWGQNTPTVSALATPFEAALAQERSQQVRQALTQLSDQQRQVIELAYDTGLSQSEISQRLNEPLGTVKSWTRQGLLKLKKLLKDTLD